MMKNARYLPLVILSVCASGCSLIPQKKPHVYHLLGSAEESTQKQASVLKENIPMEQKGRRWKMMGADKGKTYYLDVSMIFHHADKTTRMKVGDMYVHVKPYNSAYVKIQHSDGSYEIDNYSVACYENLVETFTFGKYTANHQERKIAGTLASFADVSASARYISDKNVDKMDGKIAKEICLLAPSGSFVYPKDK